jgi:citrate lyase subunit beta/citryl-CoA lyase
METAPVSDTAERRRWMVAPRHVRTSLNVPGDRIDVVRSAHTHGSDAVWIDLEEPRTPISAAQREAMRVEVGAFLRSLDPIPARPLYWVRVQSIASGDTLRDLEAVACPALSAVVLPKVDGPREIHAADALITCVEADRGLVPGSILIYPILETAEALRGAYDIACASPRVGWMGGAVSKFGDIVQAVGFRWSREGNESLMFRSAALLDVRAAGIRYPITGNWGGRLDDLDGVHAWGEQGRDLGYRGSMCAHGPLVEHFNAAYGDEDEVPS